MSIGVVRKMNNGVVNTPNSGELIDLSTGLVYSFSRPDVTFGTIPDKWNVQVHDVVNFTIYNGVAIDVTLKKKYEKGYVHGSFSQ